MKKIALISGAKGQDSSYLAEFLLEKDYTVVGLERRTSSPDYSNIEHLFVNPDFIMEQGDINDFGSIARLLKIYQPNEFYNLAAQSFVGASWDQAITTCEVNFIGPCNCLEAVRLVSPNTKFFQASTSEVYGDVLNDKQNEETPARPRSPYAAAKYGAESLVKVYRDSYKTFACYARAFNHESPRRGREFVTRKITNAIGEFHKTVLEKFIVDGNQLFYLDSFSNPTTGEIARRPVAYTDALMECLNKGYIHPIHLGNLDAKRDWSHAKDIVRGIWMMLQKETPDDYVLGSGETRTVRDFLTEAFSLMGVIDWDKYVVIDPKFYRPADVSLLCADYTKAREKLGWTPEISFKQLVKEMVANDVGII